MYAKIDTDDEGDVTIRKVVEHIRAVEAGSGNNDWVEVTTVRDVGIMFCRSTRNWMILRRLRERTLM